MTQLAPHAQEIGEPVAASDRRLRRSAAARWIARSWPLLLVLVVAAVLRVDHLKQPYVDGYSWRQNSTAMIAGNFFHADANIFHPQVDWTGPGPSYQGREFQLVTYIASIGYRVLGQQDWIGRGISVAFGLWGIFALYQLVRRVWDEAHGLAAAGVLAVLPGAVLVDRSFLPDPAMVALVVTAAWMFVAWLQTDERRYLVAATVVGTLGALVKLPGLLVGVPLVYAVVAVRGRRRALERRTLMPLGIAAVAVIVPVAAYYLYARHLALSHPPHHFAGAANWLWSRGVNAFLDERWYLDAARWEATQLLWAAPAIVLLLVGLAMPPPGFLRARRGDAPWFFHWWAVGCCLFFLIGAQELVSNPWNFHVFDPMVAALAARPLVVVVRWATPLLRRAAPALAVAALAAVVVVGQPADWWRSMGAEGYSMGLAMREVSRPGDLVVTIANDIGDPGPIYYSRRRGWVFPPADEDRDWSRLPDREQESIALYDGLRRDGADWFGVVNEHRWRIAEEQPRFHAHLERTCAVTRETDRYLVCRMRPMTGGSG